MNTRSPTQRFGDRVEAYVRARPDYPAALVGVLAERAGLGPSTVVADVGSGTGILTRLLLPHAARVYAVEPNGPMRAAAEAALGHLPGFRSVDATAEATGLAGASVGLVTAAQAFHWFDRGRTRTEFERILMPGGAVALVWNDRRLRGSDFLEGYEALLVHHCPEYLKVVHRNITPAVVAEFFRPGRVDCAVLDHAQVLDWELLLARHESQSYVPKEGPARAALLEDLRRLHAATAAADGTVVFAYDTLAYVGRFGHD